MRFSSALRSSYAAAFVGFTLMALTGCRKSANELEVAARELHYRPVEGRIYGSSYAAWPKLPDASLDAALGAPKLRGISFRVRASNASDELRARAALWDGDSRDAKQLLERITSRGHASAAVWSDYSAALYADAGQDDSFELVTALAAADYALDIDPNLPEALFNRALALEALSLREAAAEAYKKYLLIDTSSTWASEVGSRLQTLESSSENTKKAVHALERVEKSEDELFINDTAIAFPQEARSWAEGPFLGKWAECVLKKDSAGAASMLNRCRVIGRASEKHRGDSFLADTVRAIEASAHATQLAKAHLAYVRGRVAYARMNLGASITALEEARRLFDVSGSPMALLARYFLAEATLSAGDADQFASMLHDLSRRMPDRYRTLRAYIESSYARSAAIKGQHDEAIKLYRSASAAFTSLGERGGAAFTREGTAMLLANSGQTDEAWRLRHTSLVSAADAGDDLRLAITLRGAACDAVAAGRWDVAHALLNGIVETPHHNGGLRREALAWRAVAARRAGMTRTAAVDLRAAHLVERRNGDLALVEALLAKNPAEALTLLTESLNVAEQKGTSVATSQLLVERARLFRAVHQPSRAQDDLERAVALLSRDPARISSATIRDAILGTPQTAYFLLADSLDSRGESLRALDALEFFRASVDLNQNHGPRSPTVVHLPMQFHASLPARTLVITYGLFDDRLVIYASSSLRLTRTIVAANRLEVERLVSTFNRAVAHGDLPGLQNTGRSLARILIAPIEKLAATADTLVFVSDPAFGGLPFGALMHGTNHCLIQDHAVVVTPSLSSYLRASHTKTTTSGALLSVGNSLAFERSVSLASLAAAESEAKEIAAMYPSRAMLLGADATKERVVGALPYCDAAHFAVHANAGLGEAMPPHLILTGTADDEGKLTAAEIAALPLRRVRTVVLAGCRTAISSPGSSGTHSLVDAFLEAGAGSVVATLWEVEDAPTSEMSIMFHRELRKGSTPAEALRTTQVEMIRRGASPRVWAALQVYGSGK